MKLTDYQIPNESNFVKLSSYADGDIITVKGAGIQEGGFYGAQAYFIADNGTRIMLPARYVDYIENILNDRESEAELLQGIQIKKGSRPTKTGQPTPIFDIIG